MSNPGEVEIWDALVREMGEDAAKKYLVRRLREAADIIEEKGYPRVFGCDIPTHGGAIAGKGADSFIERISVILSQPWPG